MLFSGARIIILDEPTSALSPPEIERLFAVLRRLKGEGTSFIFISHFLEDVLEVSDRVTVFRNSRRIATEDAAAVDKHWLIERMIGRGHQELEEALEGEVALASDPARDRSVLEATGLGRKGAFADVSFDGARRRGARALRLHGLGPARARQGADGQARAGARVDPARRPAGAADQHLAGQAGRHRAGAREPALDAVRQGAGLQEHLDQHPRADRPRAAAPREERRIAQGHVDALQIRPYSVEPELRKLSGGNQQKVALARWLTHLPRVLVLAEPTRGMDVGAKDDVVKIVRGLKEQGVAVVVASAEPETVLALADRILVMRKGAVTREFKDEMVSKDRLLAAA